MPPTASGFKKTPSKHYGTFDEQVDQAMQDLQDTNQMLLASRRNIADADSIGRNVMIDMQSQGEQIRNAHTNVQDTMQITDESKYTLRGAGLQATMNVVFLWLIIITLAIADILVFYYFFLL